MIIDYVSSWTEQIWRIFCSCVGRNMAEFRKASQIFVPNKYIKRCHKSSFTGTKIAPTLVSVQTGWHLSTWNSIFIIWDHVLTHHVLHGPLLSNSTPSVCVWYQHRWQSISSTILHAHASLNRYESDLLEIKHSICDPVGLIFPPVPNRQVLQSANACLVKSTICVHMFCRVSIIHKCELVLAAAVVVKYEHIIIIVLVVLKQTRMMWVSREMRTIEHENININILYSQLECQTNTLILFIESVAKIWKEEWARQIHLLFILTFSNIFFFHVFA